MTPVTKRELDRLRERRESAAPVPEYALGAPVTLRERKLDALRQKCRSDFIEERLGAASGRAEFDFAFAKLNGRARNDFERSR